MKDKLMGTLVAVVGPYLVLLVLGVLTGNLAIGSREYAVITIAQVAGLVWVWGISPRRRRRQTSAREHTLTHS